MRMKKAPVPSPSSSSRVKLLLSVLVGLGLGAILVFEIIDSSKEHAIDSLLSLGGVNYNLTMDSQLHPAQNIEPFPKDASQKKNSEDVMSKPILSTAGNPGAEKDAGTEISRRYVAPETSPRPVAPENSNDPKIAPKPMNAPRRRHVELLGVACASRSKEIYAPTNFPVMRDRSFSPLRDCSDKEVCQDILYGPKPYIISENAPPLVIFYAGSLRSFSELRDQHQELLGFADGHKAVVTMHTWSAVDYSIGGVDAPPKVHVDKGGAKEEVDHVFGRSPVPVRVRVEDMNTTLEVEGRVRRFGSKVWEVAVAPVIKYAICVSFDMARKDYKAAYGEELPDNAPVIRMRPDAAFEPLRIKSFATVARYIYFNPNSAFSVYPTSFFSPMHDYGVASDSFYATSAKVMRSFCSIDLESFHSKLPRSTRSNHEMYWNEVGRAEPMIYKLLRQAGAEAVFLLDQMDFVLKRRNGAGENRYRSHEYCKELRKLAIAPWS